MELINKDIVTNINDFYIDTINYLFFSPQIFIKSHYIKELKENMENNLESKELNNDEKILVKFIIGLCKEKLEDYFSAIETFEDLLINKEFIKNPFLIGNIYSILSIIYLKVNNIDKHKNYFNLGIKFLESNYQYELLLYTYINTSITKLDIYKFDDSLYNNINNTFMLLSENEYTHSSQAYLNLGIIYSKYLNLNNTSIKLLSKALLLAKQSEQKDIEILANFYMATTYLLLDRIDEGINNFQYILDEFNEILPIPLKLNIYIGLININIELNTNLNYIKQLLDLYKNELYNLDNVYFDVFWAKYNLLKVRFKILNGESSLNELFYYLDNASYTYKGNFSKFQFMEFDYYLEISYGNLFFELKEYENALLHHKKALLYSEKFKNKNTIYSYKLVSRDYEALYNYKEALKYFKMSNELLEIYNESKKHDLYIILFENYETLKNYHLAKNNFFSNLNHELITPVNIIYSSMQLMSSLKNKDAPSIKNCFFKHERGIRQNCLRMLKLVNNLIDITKIDSGSIQLNLVSLDIVPLVEDLTLSLVSYTRYKKLNIIFDTNVEKLYAKVDPYALERILLNLLSNSIKFTNSNGNILVKLNKFDTFIQIIVRDDGIGIPSNLKDFVFNRFFKVDNSLSRKTEGSGIGLSLTKDLVEMHGGRIYFNADYSNGCEFIINLPSIMTNKDFIDNNFKHFIDDEKILKELSDIYELF